MPHSPHVSSCFVASEAPWKVAMSSSKAWLGKERGRGVDSNDGMLQVERGQHAVEEMWRQQRGRSGGGKWGVGKSLFTHYWFSVLTLV